MQSTSALKDFTRYPDTHMEQLRSFKEGRKNDQMPDDGRNDSNNGDVGPTSEAETPDSDRPFAARLNVPLPARIPWS